MDSHHDRDSSRRRRSDDRSSHRDDDGDKHRSKRKRVDLAAQGIPQIGPESFFERAVEFRLWLREDRDKRINDISSSEAHRLFDDRFVRRWNRGKLDSRYYAGLSAAEASTSDSWPAQSTSRPLLGPQIGPSRPETLEELQDRREREAEAREQATKLQAAERARTRREGRDEERSGRATGRDRLQEKKAETRSSNRAMAERKDDAGLEVSEEQLMGGSDSFAAALAARERAKGRGSELKRARHEEREAQLNGIRSEHQAKESKTMEMLRSLAAARYG